jgi:hypothetical protein
MTRQQSNDRTIALEEIERNLRVFVLPGTVTEIRIPDTPRAGTISGYFDDMAKAAAEAARWSGRVPGVYFVLNPVTEALLARASNHLIERARNTTGDGDVARRVWFLIDIDPVRASGISATEEEHRAAHALAQRIRAWLAGQGWPDCVYCDSGNGAHLVYRLDLDNTPEAALLLSRCLLALDMLFSDSVVAVDRKTFNASRITKVYGTKACKGDSTATRPHRLSHVHGTSQDVLPVPVTKLRALADRLPPEPAKGTARGGDGDFDLARWIEGHNLPVAREGPWDGTGYKWVLRECPWNSDHRDGAAYVVRTRWGAPSAGCHHNGCAGKRWEDLRELHEPGYKARKAAAEARAKPSTNGHGSGPAAPAGDKPEARPEAVWVTMDTVRVRPVTWVWHRRIPRRAVTVLDGDPDLGKSTIAIDIAARVTRGWLMPGEEREPGDHIEPAGVLLLSAEDDREATIRPRLDAANANVSRVAFVETIKTGDEQRPVVLPWDLKLVEGRIVEEGIILVVVDPFMAFLDSDINAHVDADVRRAMHQLKLLAERTGAAILVIRHLNKLAGGPALYRGGGSIGIIGAARSALVVGRHPGKPDTYVLATNKCNLAAHPPSLMYSLEPAAGDVCRIAWGGECDLTAEDILQHAGPARKTAGQKCAEALRQELAVGRREGAKVEAALLAQGYSIHAIKGAKKLLGVRSEPGGFGRSWDWWLPESTAEAEPGPG